MKKFDLNDGNKIPALGFGTWQLQGDICTKSVLTALEVGYRHIDTAERYENHEEVAAAIAQSGIAREEIFITSKVWWTELTRVKIVAECKKSLQQLKTDYLDLFLVHWPNTNISVKDSVEGMRHLKDLGLIRSFGVSNFTKHHLQDWIDQGMTPSVNQVEIHPTMGQFDMQLFCQSHNIVLTAYSPLGQGRELQLPVLAEIALKHNKTVAQVILNWLVGRGIVVIPKSTNPERIKQNFDSFDFELTKEDISLINGENTDNRLLTTSWADWDY